MTKDKQADEVKLFVGEWSASYDDIGVGDRDLQVGPWVEAIPSEPAEEFKGMEKECH